MDLIRQIERIENKADFVEFCQALLQDFNERGDDWENGTLGGYLDAFAAVADGVDQRYKNLGEKFPDPPTWRLFAEMLYTARIYE